MESRLNTAIELRDAFRIYRTDSAPTVALQGLDLTVEQGEIIVVLGPSGAGKSTLLRVLAALDRLSAGTARVLGTDLNELDGATAAGFRAAHLGLLDQHYARSLSPDLSCRHSIALQLELLGASPRRSRARADELLARVELLERADEKPSRLSGGEQQRVAVCAAVAHGPRVLLADEPAGELDGTNATIVYELLRDVVREVEATAIIVSHDPSAALIADRLVYIRDGRIVEEARPGHPPVLVISRKGWARLPDEPHEHGRARYARATLDEGRIVLTPIASEPPARRPEVGGEESSKRPAPAPAGAVRASLHEVSKRYPAAAGDRAVFERISHTFNAGVLCGLIGRSGSGKTTLLHILAGLDRPTSGEVTIAGEPLRDKSRRELADLRRREVALVTQEPGLIPYLTALENVELAIRLRRLEIPPSRAPVALDQVGLQERYHHRASDLSAGERERVAIARALATDATLLLIDEPTARLDQENAERIAALLSETAHRHGLAVVCATHDPTLIAAMDERIELAPPGR